MELRNGEGGCTAAGAVLDAAVVVPRIGETALEITRANGEDERLTSEADIGGVVARGGEGDDLSIASSAGGTVVPLGASRRANKDEEDERPCAT